MYPPSIINYRKCMFAESLTRFTRGYLHTPTFEWNTTTRASPSSSTCTVANIDRFAFAPRQVRRFQLFIQILIQIKNLGVAANRARRSDTASRAPERDTNNIQSSHRIRYSTDTRAIGANRILITQLNDMFDHFLALWGL